MRKPGVELAPQVLSAGHLVAHPGLPNLLHQPPGGDEVEVEIDAMTLASTFKAGDLNTNRLDRLIRPEPDIDEPSLSAIHRNQGRASVPSARRPQTPVGDTPLPQPSGVGKNARRHEGLPELRAHVLLSCPELSQSSDAPDPGRGTSSDRCWVLPDSKKPLGESGGWGAWR